MSARVALFLWCLALRLEEGAESFSVFPGYNRRRVHASKLQLFQENGPRGSSNVDGRGSGEGGDWWVNSNTGGEQKSAPPRSRRSRPESQPDFPYPRRRRTGNFADDSSYFFSNQQQQQQSNNNKNGAAFDSFNDVERYLEQEEDDEEERPRYNGSSRQPQPTRQRQSRGNVNDDNDDDAQRTSSFYASDYGGDGKTRDTYQQQARPSQYESNNRYGKEYEYNDEYDYYDDEEADDVDMNAPSGNFWINSAGSTNAPVSRPRGGGSSRSNGSIRPRPGGTTTNRVTASTFRSGTPSPPPAVTDLYNRLFWYGFDPNESDGSDSPADKTMFGGTKGKFNGLGYLDDLEQRTGVAASGRLLPPSRYNDDDYDDDDDDDFYAENTRRDSRDYDPEYGSVYDDDENDNDDDVVDGYDGYSYDNERGTQRVVATTTGGKRYFDTPPSDHPRSKDRKRPTTVWRSSYRQSGRRRGRRRGNEEGTEDDYHFNDNDEEDERDWDMGEQVSSWFGERDTGGGADLGGRRRRPGNEFRRRDNDDNKFGRPQQRRGPSSRATFNIIDAFFGYKREEKRQRQEELYNESMGISRRSRRRRSNRRQEQYNSDYDDDEGYEDDFDEDEYSRGVDSHATANNDRNGDQQQQQKQQPQRRNGYAYPYVEEEDDNNEPPVADYEVVPDVEENGARHLSSVQEMSWEERAMAIERVPPPNVLAWGPSGVIPDTDARTVAISHALEDIARAKCDIQTREERIAAAREDLTVCRMDLQLETKRFSQPNNNNGRANGVPRNKKVQRYLLKLQHRVDEAEREYRYAVRLHQAAQDDLTHLERRHWAVLQSYNPDKAQEMMNETLKEMGVANNPNEQQEQEPSAAQTEQPQQR